MKRRAFLATVAGSTVGLAGCVRSSAGPDADDDYDVGMSSADFRPARVEVPAGTTVVWRNTGSRRHTVTAYDDAIPDGAAFFASGGYDSESAARTAWQEGFGGAITTGETFEHTFEVPGRYDYFCVPHLPAGMVGTVVVEE